MLNRYLKTGLILLMLVAIFCQTASAQTVKGEFKSVVAFAAGEKAGQLQWNATVSGGVADGFFQGPMAFLVDQKGNFWVGDSLNGRIIGVSATGKQGREIDLIKVGRKLGLATDVALLDMVPTLNGKLLVADANNNALIEVDLRGSARCFAPSTQARRNWVQINRIHSDKSGRIYVEDLPSMKTFVLNADGEFMQTLEGELSLAVDAAGRAAMLVMDTVDQKLRHVVMSPMHGSPAEKVATLKADEPIVWAATVGFAGNGSLYTVYDTAKQRFYAIFDAKLKLVKTIAVPFVDPGYDPCRPDWISPDGRIFTVQIADNQLKILELKY